MLNIVANVRQVVPCNQSAHSNNHNNDNFHIQTRWQVYQTEIDMKVTLKTGTGRLAGTAIAGKCKVIDKPVDDINYGILKSSPW